MQLDPDGLSDEEHMRLEGILGFTLNLESGGDVLERNILPFAAKQMKRGVEFTDEAEREIEATFQAARNNLGAGRFNLYDGRSVCSSGADRAKKSFVVAKLTRSAPILFSYGKTVESRPCLSTYYATSSA